MTANTLAGITRDQIVAAITSSNIDHAAFAGYAAYDFEQELDPVMDAMDSAGIFPSDARPSLAMVWNDDGTTNGGHVIIHLPSGLNLATTFLELRRMVTDRELAGLDALVDVAQTLLAEAEHTLSLFRAL